MPLDPQAIVWTEGKTDWQHLKHALGVLKLDLRLQFRQIETDWGDDQHYKQCVALARAPQAVPTIFIFDRDKPEIVSKVEDSAIGYKNWGNNVFSFAIPVPSHRQQQPAVCIELYYTDEELRYQDGTGRRLFLSSEFDPRTGRHQSDPRLSVGNRRTIPSAHSTVRVLDSEVYDENGHNVALSKAEFASCISAPSDAYTAVTFENFRVVFEIVAKIIDEAQPKVDVVFAGLHDFIDEIDQLEKPEQLASIVEASIRLCRMAALFFAAATVRFYDRRIIEGVGPDARKVRPIKKLLAESFAQPSVESIQELARHCYHLLDEDAPENLLMLRDMIGGSPLLGPFGTLLDQLDNLFPPPARRGTRRGRSVNKSQLRKPILEYAIPELLKYDGRTADIINVASRSRDFEASDSDAWRPAINTIVDFFHPLTSIPLRVRNIERLTGEGSQFLALLTTYNKGRVRLEESKQAYSDLKDDRLETYELVLGDNGDSLSFVDIYPFFIIKNNQLLSYSRTKPEGYEYSPVFGTHGQLVPTKRKFGLVALRTTISADLQGLFWTQAAPTMSPAGVRANIPARSPIVGREQQLNTVMEEIIQIPNRDGIIYGPGGVGKTALLIELTRRLADEGGPVVLKNIIWVSAKRDYYDPTLDVIEPGSPQFESLDNILTSILEFYEMEDAQGYDREDQKCLVLECFRDAPTLLVIDNFETVKRAAQQEIIHFFVSSAKKALRDKPDYFKLLVTSRERVAMGIYPVELSGLDQDASKELMDRLYQPYQRSGLPRLTKEQENGMYGATRGIPLMIKHCYGQIYEYGRAVDSVIRGLASAANKAIDFSFAELFTVLRTDEVQRKTLLVLELIGRPLMLRQISDILQKPETDISAKLPQLVNFQCVSRSSAGMDDKYSINDDIAVFASRLVVDYASEAAAIRKQIASLTIDRRMDYTAEEFEVATVFEEHVRKRHYLPAEEFMQKRLSEHPDSVLLNYHYARYLKEIKRKPEEAILRLESIRGPSGNDPQVLRLLMAYHTASAFPNFEQAHTYATELEDIAEENVDIKFELAQFYVAWSTALKLKFELDPLREMLRQQKYKELADTAITLLKAAARQSHEWQYLLAQAQFNRWDYDSALLHIDRAINMLPKGSHLGANYRRFREEIEKKTFQYGG